MVVIDADNFTVRERLKQLDQELANAGQEGRESQERVAIFVPKRNIETWIHYLREESVDEVSSYSKLKREGDCKPDVKRLAEVICLDGLPSDAPRSLHQACDELPRIV